MNKTSNILIISTGLVLAFLAYKKIDNQPDLKLSMNKLQSPRSLPQPLELKNNYWALVFFGFTSCPDICPTTLKYLADEKLKLLENKDFLEVYFVSIDPKRDQQASEYVSHFDANFQAISPEPQRLKEYLDFFGAYSSGLKDDGMMDHSGHIYVINPQGKWFGYYSPPFKPGLITSDLRELILSSSHL